MAMMSGPESMLGDLRRLRWIHDRPVDASIVIPVNAKGDLENALHLLDDLGRYAGPNAFEVLLVVNNFAEGQPPPAITTFQAAGARVLSVSRVERRPGDAVPFSVRLLGIRNASSAWVISFDADCRIPDPTSLLDWYVIQGRRGTGLAYSHVDFYDLPPGLSIWVKIRLHHLARWTKRTILGIPTARGSNYAVRRDLVVRLYDQGYIADELNVGPVARSLGERVAYTGDRSRVVLTSGRVYRPGWRRIISYFWYRLRYNLRVLPVRSNMAKRTGRDRDPAVRYDYTRRRDG